MPNAPIYSVSELNFKVRLQLEEHYPGVGVTGEISNLIQASSGHFYFSLKDQKSQIRCAYFSGHSRKSNLVALKNGLEVVAYGKLSLYEARGDYQLIVSHLQDTGVGLLYQQFILLKNKLELAGLFHPSSKKPLPYYPSEIAIITSPKGAAIHDIMTTLSRRFPLAKTKLYPTEVQGEKAVSQIIRALEQVIQEHAADCIILARGGGSIEDLWAFNDEKLAYTLFDCPIPIITGIGHETDFTIADFVADMRAATPTAAAEKATPNQLAILEHLGHLKQKMIQWVNTQFAQKKHRLQWCQRAFLNVDKVLIHASQRHDYANRLLIEKMQSFMMSKSSQLKILCNHLEMQNPKHQLKNKQEKLKQLHSRLQFITQQQIKQKQNDFQKLNLTLQAIGPSATLNRGYAIAMRQGHVLMHASDIEENDIIDIQLADGRVQSKVLNTFEV
jgi:exodeoxyribonuclease VII large subunit